jgi:hypothetical protein
MVVLFRVCFTSNPPICLGLTFWIHAIGLCSSNTDAKTQKNRRYLRSSKEAQSIFPNKSLPDFTNSIPLKTINFTTDRPIHLNLWLESTYSFMKPFEEMQHSKKYARKYTPLPTFQKVKCVVLMAMMIIQV